MSNPTIKDVAKKADVSIATVSRVINNAENVNPEMRQKVLDVISELNYKPNRIARGLKNKTTNTIGVIVSNIANPFFMNIAKEIENIIQDHKYSLIMGSSEDNHKKESDYIKLFHEKQVDGLVISSTGKNEDYLFQLYETGLPIIFIDRRPTKKSFDSVYVDKIQSTNNMVKYLIDKGHEKIALITGSKQIITNFDRYVGYTKAFFDLDMEIKHKYLFFEEFTLEFGKRSLEALFDLPEPPTALISGSSLITEGILIKAQEKGLKIPEDFSIITFGNIDMSELITPKMTYANQMSKEIGKKAGKLLIKRIKNKEQGIERIKLESNIIEGNSVLELS